jgi:hypothetical protein
MPDPKTYSGSCHCGKVRFETTTDLSQAISCNCSICSRVGYLLSFVPEEQFKLLSGEDNLTDYQFGKRTIHHLFCSTCGVHPFGRGNSKEGKSMYAVNVRCLEGVELDALNVTRVDGKSR